MSRLNPKNLLCLLLAAVLVVLALAASQVSANQATYNFLMDLRDEYDVVKALWPNPSSTDDYCTYTGISCDASGYVEINLSNRGLDGSVSNVGFAYQYANNSIMVASIDLSYNRNLVGRLPGSWQYLTNLKYINLSHTSVGKVLPNWWESANMNLQELHISNTRLCGSLPRWNMPNLKVVNLSHNRMGGSLSESWSSMTTLTSVDISGNGFCGCVPDSWQNVPALKTAANNANAAVTASTCSSDNWCRVFDRCLGTGVSTPGTLATYDFLMQFRNEFKYLESRWPKDNPTADYCAWEDISCDDDGYVSIEIRVGVLEGNLPDLNSELRSVASQIMVASIDLSYNRNIVGSLPDSWQYLTNLRVIALFSTSVGGTLPDQWGNMPNLEVVEISDARLCGSLPTWNMPKLKLIGLASNRMGGSLSASWSNMPSLFGVELGGNAFCGCVPKTWQNVRALKAAADWANPGVRAWTCGTMNQCGSSDRCKSAASGVASLVASVAAIAAVAAAMVL